MEIKTIDLTPTWEQATKMCIAILTSKDATPAGKKAASEELLKLARSYDKIVKRNSK